MLLCALVLSFTLTSCALLHGGIFLITFVSSYPTVVHSFSRQPLLCHPDNRYWLRATLNHPSLFENTSSPQTDFFNISRSLLVAQGISKTYTGPTLVHRLVSHSQLHRPICQPA